MYGEARDMTVEKHMITLQAGDWSCDGHGLTETWVIESNLSRKELEAAYKKGKKVMDVDLVEDVCEEYEDDKISIDLIKKLNETGFDINKLHPIVKGKLSIDEEGEIVGKPELDEFDINHAGISIGSENFKDIYLHFCKVGNANFKFKELSSREEVVQIGGYGLFWH